MIKFKSLNQSAEFLRILKRNKINNKYFVIYFEKNHRNNSQYLNVSFVMKKKIGNAVIRNKVKRKLRSAVQKVTKVKGLINLNYTYVILGKNTVYKDKFALIFNEMIEIFRKIKKQTA